MCNKRWYLHPMGTVLSQCWHSYDDVLIIVMSNGCLPPVAQDVNTVFAIINLVPSLTWGCHKPRTSLHGVSGEKEGGSKVCPINCNRYGTVALEGEKKMGPLPSSSISSFSVSVKNKYTAKSDAEPQLTCKVFEIWRTKCLANGMEMSSKAPDE